MKIHEFLTEDFFGIGAKLQQRRNEKFKLQANAMLEQTFYKSLGAYLQAAKNVNPGLDISKAVIDFMVKGFRNYPGWRRKFTNAQLQAISDEFKTELETKFKGDITKIPNMPSAKKLYSSIQLVKSLVDRVDPSARVSSKPSSRTGPDVRPPRSDVSGLKDSKGNEFGYDARTKTWTIKDRSGSSKTYSQTDMWWESINQRYNSGELR